MSVDADHCLEKLYKCQILTETEVKWLCNKLQEILIEESDVKHLRSPVTVVGDVHGQFYDVKELFNIAGGPPDVSYVFLGDYVDRGYYSVETISLLVCLKVRWPSRVTLLRGNHESRQITQVYGFYDECVHKYGSPAVWEAFTNMFDYLNIAAVIDDRILCIHGGLSPSVHTLDQIRVLDRFNEVPHEGPLADLMWSDPDPDNPGFCLSQRGAGYTFGGDIIDTFLEINNITRILRAHQLCMDGYQELFDGKLATVWSAPNYCYRCGNLASALEIDEHCEGTFNTFSAAPANERVVPEMPRSRDEVPDYFM